MAAFPSSNEEERPFLSPRETQNPSISSLSKARTREPFGEKFWTKKERQGEERSLGQRDGAYLLHLCRPKLPNGRLGRQGWGDGAPSRGPSLPSLSATPWSVQLSLSLGLLRLILHSLKILVSLLPFSWSSSNLYEMSSHPCPLLAVCEPF